MQLMFPVLNEKRPSCTMLKQGWHQKKENVNPAQTIASTKKKTRDTNIIKANQKAQDELLDDRVFISGGT